MYRGSYKKLIPPSAERLLNQVCSIFFQNFWDVGLVRVPIQRFLDPDFAPQIEWLTYRGGGRKYLADPFPMQIHDRLTIVMEEFDYARGRGRIVAARWGDLKGNLKELFSADHHFSYPYVFQHQGVYYCTPECCERNEIALYAYDPVDEHWEKQHTLLKDIPACDPTLIQHEGMWWLFFSRSDDQRQEKLFLYYSTNLHGIWTSHPCNPVKSDACSSRPGGTPFTHNGELYRPAQDSSRGYGMGLALNRIVCLTTEDFREEVVRFLVKFPNTPGGIHTLSGMGDITVVDSLRRVFAWREVPRMLIRKLKRILGSKQKYLY